MESKVSIIDKYKDKMIEAACKQLKHYKDDKDFMYAYFDLDMYFCIFEDTLSTNLLDSLVDYFEGDYHDDKDFQLKELDIWILATTLMKRVNLTKEFIEMKKETNLKEN